jgi:two-component system, NtrC family, response regulator HydG
LLAEIIVVNGSLAGNRYGLGSEEFDIGRSPSTALPLADPVSAQRHCVVRNLDGLWHIVELSPGHAIYVNGLRIKNHQLEDGDRISIGDTDLIFRTDNSGGGGDTARPALLRACSLLFLFRALGSALPDSPTQALEAQLIRLIGDMIEIEDGLVLLGRSESAVMEQATARGPEPAGICGRVLREGAVTDVDRGTVAVPIYARGKFAGIIQVRVRPQRVNETPELLSAVAVLAAAAIENVREVEGLRNEKALLLEQIGGDETGLVGESGAMKRLRENVRRVAPRAATVLILGESGTGKELVARALHRHSERTGPFVALNCAALTEPLLESELFGHEKGAFTGAVVQKKGKFEIAEGGTVFLDEIGELAPGLQAKLLRVLQEREFERVGGTRTLRLDVRVIAATNRDLAVEVRGGGFREDLFHRINVVALRTSPLRERPEDILPLASYFLVRCAARCKRRVTGFSSEAETLLRGYSWPGNVRELENSIERAVVLGATETVLPEDLPETISDWFTSQSGGLAAGSSVAFLNSVGNAQRESIVHAWHQARGDYKMAAALLEVHPNSLLRLIRTLGLRDILRQP